MPEHTSLPIPRIQQIISLLWPSFLTAGIATGLLFIVFDPAQISACTGGPEVSRLGGYTLGFFLLWLLTFASSLLTWYFQKPCRQTNMKRQGAD